jgi:AraC-like DNA-binding protein
MDTVSNLLANHCRLVTSDLDHARECVGQMWEHHRSDLKRGRRYGIRWHQTEFARTSLSYASTNSALDITCGPVSDTVRVTMHLSGRLQHQINGRHAVSTVSQAVVHGPGQELRMETEPFRLLLLTFDGALVRRAFRQWSDRVPPMENWADTFSLTTTGGAALRSLALWTAKELDRPSSVLATADKPARALERTLLSVFLDTIAETAPWRDAVRSDVDDKRIRLIEEWVDAHFTEPIGVEDMAAVAGASVRTVQMLFRRRRQCTPMGAVTRRRLEMARRRLATPSDSTTVTDVAAACGFFHFGRFAAAYRQAFGERPSETLSRVRRRPRTPADIIRETKITKTADIG